MSYIRTPAAGGHFTPGVHIWCFISGKKKQKQKKKHFQLMEVDEGHITEWKNIL